MCKKKEGNSIMNINVNDRWIEKPSPKSMRKGRGWFGKMNRSYTYNGEYAAMTREINTEWGKVIHCAFRNKNGTEISWKEKQWLKDSLFGEDRVAIEVFPQKDRLIDTANMYHIWIFEKGFELPFGIHDKDKSERKE